MVSRLTRSRIWSKGILTSRTMRRGGAQSQALFEKIGNAVRVTGQQRLLLQIEQFQERLVEQPGKMRLVNEPVSVWQASYNSATAKELFSQLSSVFDEIERFSNQNGEKFI